MQRDRCRALQRGSYRQVLSTDRLRGKPGHAIFAVNELASPSKVVTDSAALGHAYLQSVATCWLLHCRTAGTGSYPLFEQPGPTIDNRTIGIRLSSLAAIR